MPTVRAPFLSVFVVAGPFLLGSALAGQPDGGPPATAALPASLDALYPPRAEGPVYLLGMLTLEEHFSGMFTDLMEGDFEGARGGFADFEAQYQKVRSMVPAWEAYYPLDPVERLEAAFRGREAGPVVSALEEIGGACHRCHVTAMVPVQQRYHWGDFGALRVQDPPTGEPAPYAVLKKRLSVNLAGIRADLKQGQKEQAMGHVRELRARFQELQTSCLACHGGPKDDYVGSATQALLERLTRAVGDPRPASEEVSGLLQSLGQESCAGCHRVHLPAAMARGR
ncbi:MAG: hypothetical protein ACNA8S_08210 [Deferrisomatales bacterium]